MRLLSENDVIYAVDSHTREDGTMDDDISIILEEVNTAYDVKKVCKKLEFFIKNEKRQRDAAFERGDKEGYHHWNGTYTAYKTALEIVKKEGRFYD